MFLAPALLACLAAAGGELDTWLERAAGPDWAERERAQRWLATHLELGDAERLAARAAGADAELRSRLARAIGSEVRLVGLAAELALAREPAAAELGREALREQILAYDAGAEEAPGTSTDWLFELRERAPERLQIPGAAAAAGACLDLLARSAPVAPPLVLDPRARLAAEPPASAERSGTLAELLLGCASASGLSVIGFGFGPEGEGRAWILVAPAEAGPGTNAAERIRSWVLGVAERSRADEERAACARALAATTWPAGIAFLEQRWLAGDVQALEGVLLAAGRGRVAPALQDPARQRALYASLAALCAREDDSAAFARASGIARALGAAGPLARSGEPLGPLALEGFAAANARERWLRLAILERQQRAFPEALAAADALLAARETAAPLALEALRLRAALAGAQALPRAPADPRALLDWASTAARLTELRALWLGLALGWSKDWNGLEARGSALVPETRAFLCEIAWRAGEREHALAFALELFRDRSPRTLMALAHVLANLAGDAPGSARALADALPADSEAEARHACAAARLAGLAPSARETERLAHWIGDGPASGEEALALATQAAGMRGKEVRAKLIELLGSTLPLDERVAALDRAALELAGQGLTAELEAFASAARERARSLKEADLRARLRPGRWPAAATGPVRDLERDEREVGRW